MEAYRYKAINAEGRVRQGRIDAANPADSPTTQAIIDSVPVKRIGLPEDIANVALFLASDESRMVNAAVIPAEGGASKY